MTRVDRIPHGSSLCIYGAGGRGERVWKALTRFRPDLKILFFVDTYKEGSFCGLPVVKDFDPAAVDSVLVASTASFHICNRLTSMGVPHCFVASHFWCTQAEFKDLGEMQGDDYQALLAALDHEEDRTFFKEVTGIMTVTDRVDLAEKAIYEKYAEFSTPYCRYIDPGKVRHVFDIGMGDGINSVQFLSRFPEAMVYGFEPETDNFMGGDFCTYLSEHPRFRLVDCALWSEPTELEFASSEESENKRTYGRVCAGGSRTVKAITMDDFVEEAGIEGGLFLKLMSNGCERDILCGAKKTLASLHPQVSVYVKSVGAVDTPPFATAAWCVRNMPGYTFRLEHFAPLELGTVLTCTHKG